MAERKAIPKKIRFEVFKRDNFTCQYCGRMSPDVVLEIDHIEPVASGGSNDILNLVTSCIDCNRGKGKRRLTENQEIKKQQDQLKELSARKEQLEFLVKWRKELQDIDEKQVDIVNTMLVEKTGIKLSEFGREKVKNVIKEFGLNNVLDSLEISLKQYYDQNDKNSVAFAINKLGGICRNRRISNGDSFVTQKAYILGILKNRFSGQYFRQDHIWDKLSQYVRSDNGVQNITILARECGSWYEFWETLEEWAEEARECLTGY